MSLDRIKLCAIAAAVAASLTGEVFGQTTGSSPGMSSPAPQTRSPSSTQSATPPSSTQPAAAPSSTQPSSSRGTAAGAQTQGTATPNATTGAGYTGGGISGGVPGMSGVTPNRAELASSAFTKLDAGNRGYVTPEDVRQLEGFESAFRQADQNGDGRLNASEFNSAWGAYTGNVR